MPPQATPPRSTVLITGAAGFIGRWVARALCAQGTRPLLCVRDAAAAQPILHRYAIDGELIEAALESEEDIQRLIERAQPDLVFNLIGYGVDRSERDEARAQWINAALPEALGKALLSQHEAPGLIHVGSALEYGRAPSVDEAAKPEPFEMYGRTKLEGTQRLEALASSTALRAVTARLFTVYGPGEHAGRLMPTLLRAAKQQETVSLSKGLQKRDFTFVEEVALGLRLLSQSLEPKTPAIVNVATGALRTVAEFVHAVAEVYGIPSQRLNLGAVPERPEEMHHGPVPTARLRALTGWCPSMSPRDGAARTKALSLEG